MVYKKLLELSQRKKSVELTIHQIMKTVYRKLLESSQWKQSV